MHTPPPLSAIIAEFGLRTQKSLGQHFLLDRQLTDKIVRHAGSLSGVHAIEIGPGPGGLTHSLLISEAASVTAIEMDPRCCRALRASLAAFGARFTLKEADALEVDLPALVPAPRAIVANLPYNVGTLLVLRWLRDWAMGGPDTYSHITVMLQKEVADRLWATPESKAYGRVSVMAQWLATVDVVMDIPPQAFSPPPKVMSSVITLRPRPNARRDVPWNAMETVVKAAFGQRRKMLHSALKTLGIDAAQLLDKAGIDGKRRAETLNISEFVALAAAYQQVLG